jgi:DNA/RNA endonuclease YhcR with UshA esterase domain
LFILYNIFFIFYFYYFFKNNPEKIKQLVDEKLTQNHIVDGQKGVAHFAYNILLKDEDGNINYFCTDSSRSIFKFLNNDGNPKIQGTWNMDPSKSSL